MLLMIYNYIKVGPLRSKASFIYIEWDPTSYLWRKNSLGDLC